MAGEIAAGYGFGSRQQSPRPAIVRGAPIVGALLGATQCRNGKLAKTQTANTPEDSASGARLSPRPVLGIAPAPPGKPILDQRVQKRQQNPADEHGYEGPDIEPKEDVPPDGHWFTGRVSVARQQNSDT